MDLKDIRYLIKEMINEVFRKFDFAKFKSLPYPRNLAYARENLHEMGRGSSREVYALSGKKVLKFARQAPGNYGRKSALPGERGLAQNEAEVDIFSNPKTKNVVAKIFAFAPDYTWLVSEIVRPLRDEQEFEKITGIEMDVFADILSQYKYMYEDFGNEDLFYVAKQFSLERIKYYQDKINVLKGDINSLHDKSPDNLIRYSDEQITSKTAAIEIQIKNNADLINHRLEIIKTLKRVEQDPQISSLFRGLAELTVTSELLADDVSRHDHFGLTGDRRLVVLDYGYTQAVRNKYYEGRNANIGKAGTHLNTLNNKQGTEITSIIKSTRQGTRSVLGEGIVHIESMKPEQLLKLLQLWNADNTKVEVTEKVDGTAMSFGVDETGEFFLKSKNKAFKSEKEFPDVFFMEPFKRYFTQLKNIDLTAVVSKAAKQKVSSFEIIGEAVPHHQHNIVYYEPKIVGPGIFVIFGLEINGQTVRNQKLLAMIADGINKLGGSAIKFYPVPKGNLYHISFDKTWTTTLEDLIKKHGNVLAKPARSPEEKETKQKVADAVNKIGMAIKAKILADPESGKGAFGPEVEGYVLKLPDGNLVKIVDKERFTKEKDINWVYMDAMIDLEKTFIKKTLENPKTLPASLKTYKLKLMAAKKEFDAGGWKKLTIPKKVEDTRDNFSLLFKRIDKIQTAIKAGVPSEKIISAIKVKQLEESFTNVLKESGNAVPGVNTLVPKKLLEFNVALAIKKMFGPAMNYTLVGNISKEFLGDIDVAIDKSELMRLVGISDPKDKELYDKTAAFVQKNSKVLAKPFPGLQMVSVLLPLVGENNKQLPAIDRETHEVLKVPGMYQLDLMIGNVGYLKKSMSGAGEGSAYKATYRVRLLTEIFANIIWKDKKDPNIKYKLDVGSKEGVRKFKFTLLPNGKRKMIGEPKLVSTDIDFALKILFGPGVPWEAVDTFEKLFSLFMSDKFKYPEVREKVLRDYKKTMQSLSFPLPKEL